MPMAALDWRFGTRTVALALLLAVTVSACGGGGAGGGTGGAADSAAGNPPPPSATAPTLTQQPAAASASDGGSATFSVAASGSAPLAYQWQRNGQDIAGATSATLTVDHVAVADSGAQYRVVVTNSAGSVTSTGAVLSVTPVTPVSVVIGPQPTSVDAKEGAAIALQVDAASSGATRYQWFRAGHPITDATGASLAIGPLRYGDDVDYTVQVSNDASAAVSRAATIRLVPATPAKPIADCIQITTPGSYSLTSDIVSDNRTQACVYVHDTQDVQIDCGNHKLTGNEYGALTIEKVIHFSLKNCTIDGGSITITRSSWGSINGNSLSWSQGAAPILIVNSMNVDHVVYAHNTITGAFQDQYSNSVTISDNQVFGSTKFSGAGAIITSFSKHARIFGNTIDGRWNGQSRWDGQTFPFGFDDGIIADQLSDVIIENNTIRNVWDAGIEWLGSISDSIIRGNHIEKAGVCAIGGWYSSSVWNVQFVRNEASDVSKMFYILRIGGLVPAGSDPQHTSPAETEVRFRDNVFDGNVLLPPFGGAQGSVIPIYDKMGYTGDKSSLPDSAFNIGNNVFRNNDFGAGVEGPYFGTSPFVPALVIDGGGNKCVKSWPDPYPLACN
jgi:parallel beta-helix repeat protein